MKHIIYCLFIFAMIAGNSLTIQGSVASSSLNDSPVKPPLLPGVDITVSTTQDIIDPNDGKCSLREAVIAVNNSAGSTSPGECPVGSPSASDTIILASEVYSLTISGANEDYAATGDLDIHEDVQILGTRMGETIISMSNGVGDRVFDIFSSATLLAEKLTIQGGNLAGAYQDGAGMRIQIGQAKLDFVTFKDNHALDPVTIENKGGAIYVNVNQGLIVTNSWFVNNKAYLGGAIFIAGSDPAQQVEIQQSLFRGNSARAGGAILNAGTMWIENTTFTENLADNNGGAITNQNKLTLRFSTLVKNSALVYGAGAIRTVNNPGGYSLVVGTIFAGNIGSEASNRNCHPSEVYDPNSKYNLVDDNSCNFGAGNGNVYNTFPRLGTLGDYGGETLTIPLLVSSPAIDQVPPADCMLNRDQRDFLRPTDGNGDGAAVCDIGAFEAEKNYGSALYLPLIGK